MLQIVKLFICEHICVFHHLKLLYFRLELCHIVLRLCRLLRLICTVKSATYGIADNSADCTAYSCHSAKAYTHIGKLTDSLVLCHILCNIKATLLLIGVAFLLTLCSHSLRFNHGSLCLRFGINNRCLLTNFSLGNICILSEMK